MSDSTPEELAEKLWFPLDDPRSDGGIADGLGIDNRLAIKELGRQAFVEGDADGFLWSAPNKYAMQMVEGNVLPLLRRGIYEKALVHAITDTRTNNRHLPLTVFRDMFRWADRAKLLAAGDPLPGSGPFTLYRGVAGTTERARRVRGISWTGTLTKAAWFADRGWGLANPEVYKCVLDAKHVLAYVNDREEDEYIVLLPRSATFERVALPPPRAEGGGMSEQRLQDDDDLFYRPAARAKQATVEYSTGELRERLALTKAIRANLKEIDAYRNWVSIRTLAAAAGMPIAQPQREETDADGTVGSPGRSGD